MTPRPRSRATALGKPIAVGLLAAVCAACATGSAHAPSAEPAASGPFAASTTTQPGRYGQERIEGPQDARNHYAPVVAMLTPGYTIRLSPAAEDDDAEHGFVWSVPVWFREPEWRHGAAFSIAQYPTTGRRTGRLVYRLRAWSAPTENAIVHMLVGAGGYWDIDEGPGPRAELGWLLGRYGRGGALLGLGWEYAASERLHSGDLSFTFYVPYVVR